MEISLAIVWKYPEQENVIHKTIKQNYLFYTLSWRLTDLLSISALGLIDMSANFFSNENTKQKVYVTDCKGYRIAK
jgi:hypothetical protein